MWKIFVDDFIADLKAQGLAKNSSYTVKRNVNVRYYVRGEVVEGHDLQTLQGTRWLNDKVSIQCHCFKRRLPVGINQTVLYLN